VSQSQSQSQNSQILSQRPANKIPTELEENIWKCLETNLREKPQDSSVKVFTSTTRNGLKALYQAEFHPRIPFTTFRNSVKRFMAEKGLRKLLKIRHDHCVCPQCTKLQSKIEQLEAELKEHSNVGFCFIFDSAK